MNMVIINGNLMVVSVYVLVSIFGYLTVVGTPNEQILIDEANYLAIDYHGGIWFTIAVLAMLFSVFCATPICMLPAKDSFEQMVYN